MAFGDDLSALHTGLGDDLPLGLFAPSGHVERRQGQSGGVRPADGVGLSTLPIAISSSMVVAPCKDPMAVGNDAGHLDTTGRPF